MKKLFFLITVFLLSSQFRPAYAQLNRGMFRATVAPTVAALKEERRNALIELKNTISPTVAAIKQQVQEQRKGIIDQIKEKIKSTVAHRFHGTLKGISDTTLTVATEKGDITVYVTGSTILKRRFGANSTLEEFAVNDELAIVGKQRNGGTESEIEAKYIRNLSIQRRNTVFSGMINTINAGDNSFTVNTLNRGLQTVYVNSDTVITDKNKTITFADLNAGDRLIVKGELWDRANTKIDAKRIMRLPPKPTAAVTPAITP